MKKLRSLSLISIFGLILFSFVLTFTSCEVGLGSAVDTQAPTVSITYPPSLSIIKDSFVLAGTWTDDMGVKKINVEVYQSSDEGKKLVHSDQATVGEDGSWTINLNNFDAANASYYNGWQFCDGNYEIQVQAEDNAKHTSGVASRSFSVDNTAPVLVITNPTTAGNDLTPAAFGQIVQLTGSFYDFCGKISNLTVSFYDEAGKAICDSTFSNITSMSDASPLVIARYFGDPAQQQENKKIFDNYCALLGAAKMTAFAEGSSFADTKIYFSLTASDEAKVYQTVGDEGTGDGNLSLQYYRGTTSMQNLVSGDGGIDNFSLADFASYLNKTSSAFNTYAQLINTTANAALSYSATTGALGDIGPYIANTDSSNGDSVYLTYTVNPMNNPHYTIGGYEVVSAQDAAADPNGYSSEGYKKSYTGAPVPVSISVGKDQKNISTHTVTIYCVDVTKYGSANIDKSMFTGDTGLANYNAGYFTVLATWDADVVEQFHAWGKNLDTGVYTPTNSDANVSSISKQVTIAFENAGNNYLYYVTGKDITGNDLVASNDKGFGFCGTTNTSAATIRATAGNSLNEVVNLYKFNGQPKAPATSITRLDEVLYLQGYITTEEKLKNLSYTLTVTNSADSSKTYTKNDVISIAEVTQAPDYSSDFTSSYCYTTDAVSNSKTYYWRWTAASGAAVFNSIITSEGSYDVSFTLNADNGAASNFQRTFTIDNKNPDTEPSDITTGQLVVPARDGGGYWINPAKDLTISGLVSDNLSTSKACKTWVKLVAFDNTESEVSTKSFTTPPVSGGSKWDITIDASDLPAKDAQDKYYYGVKLYIYSEDVAGNQGVIENPIWLYFDTVAPKGIHLIDYYNKDIVFRVSDFDSSAADVAATAGTVAYSEDLDKDVGGKYLMGSYSNTTTLKIRGYFQEEDSGVDMIYYKVFPATAPTDTGPTDSDIASFETDYATSATGSFKPLASSETRQVMYQTDASTWHAAKVKSTFKETITGLDAPNNYLLLLAVDKVGNVAVDSLEAEKITKPATGQTNPVCEWTPVAGGDVTTTIDPSWNGGSNAFSLNVDQESPILECTSHSGQQYTNGVKEITVSGKFNDNPAVKCSGVSYISITVGGKETKAIITPKSTDDYSEGTWTATISSNDLQTLNSTKPNNVDGSIKDKAGNTSSSTLFTLSVDKTAPAVEIATPTAGSKVNGTISLSGSVNFDGSAPVKLELYASKTKPTDGDVFTNTSKYTQIGSAITDAARIYSWTFADIDTYELTGVENAPTTADLYLIPVVTDGAGNTNTYNLTSKKNEFTENTNYFKYTVDMDSDRPTVKVTNLTNTGTEQAPVYILKYGENAKIEGSISDDDATSAAVVKTFVASDSEITTPAANSIATAATGTTTYNPATGEWSFTPAVTDDGQKTVYFYVVDNADTLFYTGKIETVATSTGKKDYKQPKFQFKTGTAVSSSSALSYKSDSTSPVIQYTKVQNGVDEQNNPKWDDVTASTRLGGSARSEAVFKIAASDANGIEDIRLTLNYKEGGTAKTLKIASKAGISGFTKKGSTASGTGNEAGYYIWTIGGTDAIDLSAWASDNVTGTVEAYDSSGLLATASPVFFVDNAGPSVTVNSPSSTEELTGTQKFAGISTDSGSEITQTAWIIPTAAQRGMTDAALAALTTWNADYNGTSSASAWEFELSGATLTNNIGNATASNEGVYTIPFYVKSTDALGNYTINKDKTIRYNPEGDRPKTRITYPNDSEYKPGENYLTLGGAIRITGTAEIPSGSSTVKATYLQVINGTGNSANLYTTTSAYVSGLKYNSNPCYSVQTAADAAPSLGFTNLNFATGVNSDAWWGIKVNNAASWNFTINNNGEMNPPENSDTVTYIAIRACAVNEEGKVGAWSDWYYINIDNTAPTQDAFMYQFKTTQPSAGCAAATILANANVTASNAYSSGMYLKGSWYLTVKLYDESAIESYEVKKGVDTLSAGTDYKASSVIGTGTNPKTQYLFIPVDTSNPAVTYTVTVNDTEHSISKTYSLNIDNAAPVIESVYKGESLSQDASNALNTTENKITDSNYIYTLGSKVEETASGFDRFVFYYVRAGDSYTNEALLDPLITTGTSAAKVALSDLTARTFTQGSTNYTLYAKAVAGKLGADGYTFTPTTAAEITANAHIRKGGLIEANGVLRKIEKIENGVVTFDTSSGVTAETDNVTVYFPYAQVVDNTGNESTTDNTGSSFVFKNNSDDGDGMPESVEGSKTTGYTLTSTIHSKNMPDGPCALVVLAFDKAGNVSGKTYPVKIENSAPRLAKVWLGTDLNSSNSWQSNEFVGYDLYNTNSDLGVTTDGVKETLSIHTAATGSAFKIKDKLAVIAEIVGGNGDIMMVYGKNATNANPVPKANGNTNVAAVNNTIAVAANATDAIASVTYNSINNVATSLKGFTLTSAQLVGTVAESNDGTNKKASFTFWDSTEELTQGTDSQNCVLHVDDFTIDLVDGVKPNVVINPFYWTSLTDNNIYGSESAQKISDLQGHIELEANWTALADDGTTKLTSWDGKGKKQSTALDSDPKVSGKIVLRGTAYDDKLLNTLQFSMTNFDAGATKTFATYSSADDKWTVTQVSSADPTMDTNYYEVSVTEDYLDQRGHKVNWEIAIDTSHLSDVAYIDAAFTVTALDKAGGSSTDRTASETAGDATLHRPTYVMDVVPYITGIRRDTTLTDTHRSRLGKYQVALGEDVIISGFNLPGTTANAIKLQVSGQQDKPTGTVKTQITAKNGSTKDSMTFTVPATSGYIKVVTSNISSINNYNIGNEMEGDNDSDEWTDDVYLNVWKNDEYFAGSPDPISPAMDRIAANKKNNTYNENVYTLYGGWAANSSKFFASYPDSTSTAATGNATAPSTGNFGDPASYYDVVIDSSGNLYHCLLDCWQGQNGSGQNYQRGYWGRNFVINKNGSYTHNNTDGSTNATTDNIIERMGWNTLPEYETHVNGYDAMFNQFLNPRITYKNNYAYLTYYDRYAKCLKFASMQFNANGNNRTNKYSTEAGNYTNGKFVVAGYETLQSGGTKSAMDVGIWSSIVVDSETDKTDSPVIAYYDTKNKQLMIATANTRSQHPENTNNNVLANGTTQTAPTGGTTPGEGNAWKHTAVTGSANYRLGQYVSMAIDGGMNLHIAAYGTAKGNKLYYIYGAKQSYGNYTFTITCVDAEGAGTWTDIQLENPAGSGSAAKPVISYYDPSNDSSENAVKVAYLDGGVWDTMTAPLASSAVSNRITLALDVTDGDSVATATANNSKLAIGYVSSRFDCVYLRKE